jgi:hypothetical protein
MGSFRNGYKYYKKATPQKKILKNWGLFIHGYFSASGCKIKPDSKEIKLTSSRVCI